jgi:hypothetical protein
VIEINLLRPDEGRKEKEFEPRMNTDAHGSENEK